MICGGMKAMLQATAAALLTAGVAGAGALVCAPRALANDAEYLGRLYEVGEFWFYEEDEQYLIDAGFTACDALDSGFDNEYTLNSIVEDADGWLEPADAQVIYDAAMEFLC